MCLVLGGLGGVFAATATEPAPAAARFVPPRAAAYDFSLRNQDGKRTSLADARGKVVALTFIYATCRDLCPAEGSDIATAMRRSAATASRPTSSASTRSATRPRARATG